MPSGYSIYVERASYVHRKIDPRTKTLAVVISFVLSLMYNSPLPLAIVVVLLFGIALWAQLPFSVIRMVLLSGVWFVVLSLIIWPAYVHSGATLFRISTFQITDKGLWFGLAMGLRVTVMVLSAGIWMASTSPQKITASFLKMGLPYKIGMAISLAIRLVPLVAGEWVTIVEAQRSRGVDYRRGNPFAMIKKTVMILGPMLLRAIDIAQSLAIALEARAFGAKTGRTTITEVELRQMDYVVMAGLILIAGFGVYCRATDLGVLLPKYL